MADQADPAGGLTPPILLDVTRLVSRIGRGHPTGIDRVEAAWLGRLCGDTRHRLLCRTRFGQLVLAARQGAAILEALGLTPDGQTEGAALQRPPGTGALVRLAREARLARSALARAGPQGQGLSQAFARAGLAADAVYLNVGHANLAPGLLSRLPLRRAVLIHDTIPLDYPHWTRPGQDAVFRDRLLAALAHADWLLTVSEASAERLLAWQTQLGAPARVPILAAPIGTRLAHPDLAQPLPVAPYFLTLGTIEPRKNHALLLDCWARLPDPPGLIIAGRRGWLNEAVFARLDSLPAGGPIREAPDLSDGAIAALMAGAQALLFPSRAEGFGLPLTEAGARGVPILALGLPSTKEILGDYVQYLPDDADAWVAAVLRLTQKPQVRQIPASVPDWPGHFHLVLAAFSAR